MEWNADVERIIMELHVKMNIVQIIAMEEENVNLVFVSVRVDGVEKTVHCRHVRMSAQDKGSAIKANVLVMMDSEEKTVQKRLVLTIAMDMEGATQKTNVNVISLT
jgi:N-acetylglutamate synthase/N-acetylornithine aminotransferase